MVVAFRVALKILKYRSQTEPRPVKRSKISENFFFVFVGQFVVDQNARECPILTPRIASTVAERGQPVCFNVDLRGQRVGRTRGPDGHWLYLGEVVNFEPTGPSYDPAPVGSAVQFDVHIFSFRLRDAFAGRSSVDCQQAARTFPASASLDLALQGGRQLVTRPDWAAFSTNDFIRGDDFGRYHGLATTFRAGPRLLARGLPYVIMSVAMARDDVGDFVPYRVQDVVKVVF